MTGAEGAFSKASNFEPGRPLDIARRPFRAHNRAITAPPPRHYPVTESVALPPIRGKHYAPTSTPAVRHPIRVNPAPGLSEVQGRDDARQHRACTPGRRFAYV